MKKINFIPFEKVKKEALKNPGVKRAYDDLEAEYQLKTLLMQKRIEEKLTQKQLAKRIGTKQSAISRFESGTYNPSLAWIKQVAHALNAKITISVIRK